VGKGNEKVGEKRNEKNTQNIPKTTTGFESSLERENIAGQWILLLVGGRKRQKLSLIETLLYGIYSSFRSVLENRK